MPIIDKRSKDLKKLFIDADHIYESLEFKKIDLNNSYWSSNYYLFSGKINDFKNISEIDELIDQIKAKIKTGASPRHVPAKIISVQDIPRTKSGKIAELAVRDLIHNKPINNITALANPECLEEYKNIKELSA